MCAFISGVGVRAGGTCPRCPPMSRALLTYTPIPYIHIYTLHTQLYRTYTSIPYIHIYTVHTHLYLTYTTIPYIHIYTAHTQLYRTMYIQIYTAQCTYKSILHIRIYTLHTHLYRTYTPIPYIHIYTVHTHLYRTCTPISYIHTYSVHFPSNAISLGLNNIPKSINDRNSYTFRYNIYLYVNVRNVIII